MPLPTPLTPHPLRSFTCLALSETSQPINIGILAHSREAAISTAMELFPDHTLSVVQLSPEW